MTADKESPTNGKESSHRHVDAATTGLEYPLVDVAFLLDHDRHNGEIHIRIGLTQKEAETVYRDNFEVHRRTGPNSGVTESIDQWGYPDDLRKQLLQVLGFWGSIEDLNLRNNQSNGGFEGISHG